MNHVVKSFDCSDIITKKHQDDCIRTVATLFDNDVYIKDIPKFQSHSDIFIYSTLKIFRQTFTKSAFAFIGHSATDEDVFNVIKKDKLKMWCYKGCPDTIPNWHNHNIFDNETGKNLNCICGVYYLQNPDNLGTVFEGVELNDIKPFTWYIFPGSLNHKAPSHASSDRYTLAADLILP